MLTKEQKTMIYFLLKSANADAACYNANIDRRTLNQWLLETEFKNELLKASKNQTKQKRGK